MDALIGEVFDTLKDLGLADITRIALTSDHGDNVGALGMWGRSHLYQESNGVPFILSGTSWFETADTGYDPDRIVFSEYHAAQSSTGPFYDRA